MKKFEIIKNSESNTGYDIPDNEFMGQTCNLNGWQFEYIMPDGSINYSDVKFTNAMPEEYAEDDSTYMHWVMEVNSIRFSGRVIFRGYYREFYDMFDGKWEPFVEEVAFDVGDLLYADEGFEDEAYNDEYDYLYNAI